MSERKTLKRAIVAGAAAVAAVFSANGCGLPDQASERLTGVKSVELTDGHNEPSEKMVAEVRIGKFRTVAGDEICGVQVDAEDGLNVDSHMSVRSTNPEKQVDFGNYQSQPAVSAGGERTGRKGVDLEMPEVGDRGAVRIGDGVASVTVENVDGQVRMSLSDGRTLRGTDGRNGRPCGDFGL